MKNLHQYTSWFYFNPFFGEANIEQSGTVGLLKSGLNVALWAAGVGVAAHLAGSKRPVMWAAGAFGLAVAGEILFGLSGPSTDGNHVQLQTAAPGTAASPGPWAGTPGASVRSYGSTAEARGFGEQGLGYN